MSTYIGKTQEKNRSQSAVNDIAQKQSSSEYPCQLIDNRPVATAHRKLQEMAHNSLQAKKIAQVQAMANNFSTQQRSPIQQQKNKTGLPDDLKTGIEDLSGYSMDDVQVTYNSDKPAQLQAHAYAQGADIHIVSGQEKHLPHEAWHVVQQKQGRVEPNIQMAGIAINDNASLETEATVMGAKALQMRPNEHASRPIVNTIAQKKNNPVQRAIIAHGTIDGLTVDMDTANKNASKIQIDTMWNGGKRTGLFALYSSLKWVNPENHPNNNKALQNYITNYVSKQRQDDPNANVAGVAKKALFDLMNPAGDETGIINNPGIGEQLPNHPTARQTHALNVRSWQIGDIVDGISWSTLGNHLQGRMGAVAYVQLGDGILARRDLQNGTNLQATTGNVQKGNIARASLVRVAGEIRGGLNGLPSKAGVSYRAADSAAGVYGSTINVGDYIKDMSFWSTSALKLSHQGHDYGSEGTLNNPKVYYIITGSSGVFVPRFTNKETSVREVLFKDQTIFGVTKVINYANRTFFVYVTETDPATLPANQVTKNPWSGANNP